MDQNAKELKVMEYNEALQMTQGLEARGDFQFKGIHKMFTMVAEWTEKFGTNHILPASEQIMREVVLDRSRFDLFVNELCIKTSPPLLKKISMLEFNPNGSGSAEYLDGYLRLLTVFARPGVKDQGSALRYITAINEQSIKAIVRYIKEVRKGNPGERIKDTIVSKIGENKLSETYASAEIGNLFNNPYDKDKNQKDETLKLHLKPVLKSLVEEKYLYFFRNENATKPVNKSVFFFNDNNSMQLRIEAYKSVLKKKIVPDLVRIGVIGNIPESDYDDIRKVASLVLPYLNDSYGDQKTMVEELQILHDFYEKGKQEEEKKKKKDKVDDVLKFVKDSGKIVDVKNIRIKGEPLDEELVNLLRTNENVRVADFADKKDFYEFILHKDNIGSALDFARKLFKTSKNDRDIQILRLMEITNVDPKFKEAFEKLEGESLFEYLPFLTWLWRAIFGNTKVYKHEAEEIKSKISAEQKEQIIKHKTKQVQKEKAKLVQERMKGKDKDKDDDGDVVAEKPDQRKEENQSDAAQKENEEKETVEKIVNILDSAWSKNVFPDREYLLRELGGSVQEEQLIFFLKKHASRNIFSYQIRNQPEKYKWPILISRVYLKRNGEKLLTRAKKEVDKQKAESMPNQEQFDIFSSLEDFLVRILPKIAK